MEIIDLKNIYLNHQPISLKIAPAGMAIKNEINQQIISIKKDDMKTISLYWGLQNYNLRIIAGETFNIYNIPSHITEEIKQKIDQWYSIDIVERPVEYMRPTNCNLTLQNDNFEFLNGKNLVFDLHKNEIENIVDINDELVISLKDEEEGVCELKIDCGAELVQLVQETADLKKIQEIFKVENLRNIYPRGRNDAIFYNKYLKLIGKTYEHTITYKNINELYILEYEEKNSVEFYYFIINLNLPIRQGNTEYDYVAIILTNEQELNLQMEENYEGPICDTLPSVMQKLSGSRLYKSVTSKMVHVTLKITDGYIYFLETQLVFVPKVVIIDYEMIKSVEFSRINLSNATSRTFDMLVICENGNYPFNNINKDDFPQIEQLFGEKNINMRNAVFADEESSYSEEESSESDLKDMITSSDY